MQPFFRSKPEDQLRKQVEMTEGRIGAPLRPAYSDLDFLKASLVELKKRYPKRYDFYLNELKREVQERSGQGSPLGEEEARRMKNWLLALNSIDEYIFKHKQGQEQTLREKQLPIFESIREYFEQGGSRGYVKLPTGTGKTVIFTELIEAANLKTLVVVPREILLEQTQKKIMQFAPELNTGLVYADAKEHGRQVTIITYDSFVAGVENGSIKPEEYDLLVLDEAHRALSEMRKKAINKFPHALRIGFTATPEFSEKKKVENILPDCITEMSIKDAVEQGMLCSFVSGIIETEVDLSGVKLGEEGEYDEKMLEKAVDIESRNRGAVEVYNQLTPGEKAVVYCVGIEHAKHAAEKFVESGVSAAAIWGEMATNDKKDVLSKYHRGEVKVLCNADLLIEGFDDCEVRLCVNLRPTRSQVIAEQRGGRVLRLNEKNLDKIAYIVDFLDRNGETGLDGAILFPEIAGQVYGRRDTKTPTDAILSEEGSENSDPENEGKEHQDEDEEKTQSIYEDFKKIDLKGMKAVFDVKEIVKMINERNKTIEPIKFLTYKDWILEIKGAGIKSIKHYDELRRGHPNWPSAPERSYKKDWNGWESITGNISSSRRSKEILKIDAFKASLEELGGIKNQEEYWTLQKERPEWPYDPTEHYAESGLRWQDLTGRISNKDRTFISLEDLARTAKEAAVKNQSDYREKRKDHPDWPSNPPAYYGESWPGWSILTGNVHHREKTFLDFADFIEAARAENIQNVKMYRSVKKLHPDWPSSPELIYAEDWTGWESITGNKADTKKDLPYDQFIEEVKPFKFKSAKEYKEEKKKHPHWPTSPDKHYTEWKDWSVVTGNPPKKKSQ